MQGITELLAGPLFISHHGIRQFAPIVLGAMSGKSISVSESVISANQKKNSPFLVSSSFSSSIGNNQNNPNNSKKVGVIPILGAITKYDQPCGPYGLETKLVSLNNYINDESIGAIILKIDSPGGEGSFLDVFSKTIRDAGKPTLIYVEGMAASAGYWIASQADEIYASSEYDYIGSIGSYITIADYTKQFEKKGIKIKEIYSDLSPDKNKFYRDLFSDTEDETLVKEMLNKHVEKFHADVNIKRDIQETNVLGGAIFHAKDSIDNGLIDGIKSFKDVVNRAFELINNTNNSNNMNTQEKNFKNITKAVAFDSENIVLTDGYASFSEENLNAIDAKLADLVTANGTIDSLNTQISDKDNSISLKDTSISEKDAEIQRLKDENKVLKDKAAGKGTSTKKNKDEFNDGYDVDISQLAHNKLVDEIF